jgi:hypothetical protein
VPVTSSTQVLTRIALFGGLLLCLSVNLSAQEAQTEESSRPITESAERLGRQLWPTEMVVTIDEQGRPRFRTGIEVELPPSAWVLDDAGGLHFRPFGGANHSEFLYMVTPEAFRAGTMYPCCIGFDPAVVRDAIKSAWHSYQERRVRARIQQEVDDLKAAADAKQD